MYIKDLKGKGRERKLWHQNKRHKVPLYCKSTTKKNLSEVQTEIDSTYHIHEELPGYKIDRKNSVQLPELVTITASPELYEPSLIWG